MKIRHLVLLLLTIAFAACKKKEITVDEGPILETIKTNLAAMQKEDADAVMATVHPESPDFATTKALVENVFARFDLKFTVLDMKVESASDTEAKVRFTQKTERVSGDETFTDNIVEGVHTLKKDQGTWKLAKTVPSKMTPLKASEPPATPAVVPLTPAPAGAETPAVP